MAFHWLETRIAEEKDRREREAQILTQLPVALEELGGHLAGCVADYQAAFGQDSADFHMYGAKIRIAVREQEDGKWQPRSKLEISVVATLPGFRIETDGEPVLIEVGILPGDKVYYKLQEQYLTLEDLTRHILDRALFPRLLN